MLFVEDGRVEQEPLVFGTELPTVLGGAKVQRSVLREQLAAETG